MKFLGISAASQVPIPSWYFDKKLLESNGHKTMTAGTAFTWCLDLHDVKPSILSLIKPVKDSEVQKLDNLTRLGLSLTKNEELKKYLESRFLIDVLQEFQSASYIDVDVQEWMKHLRPLHPRLYSVSSAPTPSDDNNV